LERAVKRVLIALLLLMPVPAASASAETITWVEAIADHTADGKQDVVTGSQLDGGSVVSLRRGTDAGVVWSRAYGGAGFDVFDDRDVLVTDFTATRALEMVDGHTGRARWRKEIPSPYSDMAFEMPDATGDARADILVRTQRDAIVLDGADGSEVGRIPGVNAIDDLNKTYLLAVSAVPIADVDGDGLGDVLVPAHAWCVVTCVAPNAISLFSARGTLRWAMPEAAAVASFETSDLDADGRPDLLGYANDAIVARRGVDGSLLWTRGMMPNVVTHLTGDADGDGVRDIAYVAGLLPDWTGGVAGLLSGRTGGNIVAPYTPNCGIAAGHEYTWSLYLAGDLNGDGIEDLWAECALQDPRYAGQTFRTPTNGRDGSMLWTALRPGEISAHGPLRRDATGDGIADFVVNQGDYDDGLTQVFTGYSSEPAWSAEPVHVRTAADLTGDAAAELIVRVEPYSDWSWAAYGPHGQIWRIPS
jgi:hypothetical protein